MKELRSTLLALVAGSLICSVSAAQQTLWQLNTGCESWGMTIERVGDLDGDGVADMIVGCPDSDLGGLGSGRVFAISSLGAILWTADGAPGQPGPWGTDDGDALGRQVGHLGDINGDGIPDVAATDDYARVKILSGLTGATLRTHIEVVSTPQILPLGELTGDQAMEYLISDPYGGALSPTGHALGRVWIFDGQTGAVVYTVDGQPGGTGGVVLGEFGFDVSVGGDWDGDGIPDWAAGAPAYDNGADADAGMVRIHSGASGSIIATYIGAFDHHLLGSTVQFVGDLNGDGTGELLIGGLQDLVWVTAA
jgi:hypothetical protein